MPYPPDDPRRGEVYWADFSPARGSEQAGMRPALVVSLDSFNRRMSVVLVLPFTSTIRDQASVIAPVIQPTGALVNESAVLTFQPLALARVRLSGYVTTLSEADMRRVDEGMKVSLGLREEPQPPAPAVSSN